jgi:sodium/proline symporter
MEKMTLTALILYCSILFIIAYLSYRKQTKATFLVGDRSLNFYVTAISAHASDMSSWIFMGFPAVVYASGAINLWSAIGLLIFMFLNWHFVAPKLRKETERLNAFTLSEYFQKRFNDTTHIISILTACFSLVFYMFYVCSGLVGMGYLFEILFNIDYSVGLFIGILLSTLYVFTGGFITIAWTDLFQGLFLLFALILVPMLATSHVQTIPNLSSQFAAFFQTMRSFFPLLLILGWGLGYFGQPHILTKFMGIDRPKELYKSKWIGMCWLFLSLLFSYYVGVVGKAFFPTPLTNNSFVFVLLAKGVLGPFFASFILCGVMAAIISTMNSQILVLSSNIANDLYKNIFHRSANDQHILVASRLAILLIGLFAYVIAINKIASIYELVLFSWSGLGAVFGPLLLLSLYSNKVTRNGSIAGVVAGFCSILVFEGLSIYRLSTIPPLVPSFFISLFANYFFSLSKRWSKR